MYYQITINHPRSARFKKMLSSKQKNHLLSIFQIPIKHFKDHVKDSDYVFELCQDGQIHLHGWYNLEFEKEIPHIILNDIAKLLHSCIKYKKIEYSEKNFFPQYDRYRSAPICVQYKTDNSEYENYMRKNPI